MRFVLVAAIAAAIVVPAEGATLSGFATHNGKRAVGAFVTARDTTRGVSWSVRTGPDGTYRLELAEGAYVASARTRGASASTQPVGLASTATADFALSSPVDAALDAPSRAYLGLLPDGEEKRRFAVDCLGCHALNARVVLDSTGEPWDEAGWKKSTDKMLSFAGHTTHFPILPPDRASEPTARFVARYLTSQAIAGACASTEPVGMPATSYTVTEWDLPDQNDFPHDLMRDGRGGILITGMFSGLMYVLDPKTHAFSTVEIPVPMANPRALDVDKNGDWWILCGFPNKIARRRASAGTWDVFDIGVYGHSVGVDAHQRAWFNGHFTRDPIRFGYVDGTTGKTHTLDAPATAMPPEQGSPIPYELRVGPDGTVWMTELAGNRLLRHDPGTGATKAYPLPSPHSGPRRCDVSPDGTVWVPEFAGGKLARFDPKTERFEEFDLPVHDTLPYCARVDPRRGVVWVSLCAADAIARFDPATKTFALFELPTRNAFIRHLDVDPESGEVWAAYSHSPNLEMRIARLRVAN
ncbi:MAG TPA: hypothetical protein VEC56_09980 [Candidatus Krumholzibacteria bacterium]|nr:hypothetical protein [Candidatus Krumholzibacteria bacterium]